ncbi:phosphatase [Actinopolyspora erythraea]|uniref:Phosphatase n=1 Tax=Actinopolyspora erythraea TaxID=414996 RepID=A0ABR4X357_9ACTN|nr:HAD family hydrolase [Actinopolyspora erythraea]KGI81074.1 phosphatase [Actinopolyspora erythraea]
MSGSGELPPTRHIVWDWNGTLLADNEAVVTSVNAVCAAYGAEPVDLAGWRAVFGRPLRGAYERVLGRELDQRDWRAIDRIYHDTYRRLLHTCELAADAPHALREWRERGGSQSLLSMFFHDELVPLVERFGVGPVFGRIDGLRDSDIGGSKAAFLDAHLRSLELEPTETAVIGDVVDDAHAAEEVGARCVLVSTGVMSREALENTGSPVADSLREAVARLTAAAVL